MRISDWSSDVCSSDLTMDGKEGHGKDKEAATQLSDTERALVMAKQSGAEVLLQVGSLAEDTSAPAKRIFCIERKTVASGQSMSVLVDHGGCRLTHTKFSKHMYPIT